MFKYFVPAHEKQRIFDSVKDGILAEWIRHRPGTRPDFWWRMEAPEKSRKRLGGVGTPCHECLNDVERYEYGLPTNFVDQFSVDLYIGQAVDVNGERIKLAIYHEAADDKFTGVAIDPAVPPTYESQPAYLKRHGLLTKEEARRLKPKDFRPEIIRE